MDAEEPIQESKRRVTNLNALIYSLLSILVIYGIMAFIANQTNRWEELFNITTAVASTAVGGFLCGFFVYKKMKDWLILSLFIALVIAICGLLAIIFTNVLQYAFFAPILEFGFALGSSLAGYGLSLPLQNKK
jgi:cytochrome bd-type quinol oxidase subunit 2